MNGKRFLDISVCSLSVAVMILSYLYIEQDSPRLLILVIGTIIFFIFLFWAVSDSEKTGQKRQKPRKGARKKRGIYSLILLDEDDQGIAEWNIAGKISVLIGRDSHRDNVDVNLLNTAFAGMVDRQHAVMNYTAGQWYIEDLDSANGIRIQKEDGVIYEVAKGQPCLVEKGDVLIIGLTKLAAG